MAVSIGASTAAADSKRTAEADKYIEMLNSDSYKIRLDAAKFVTRSGLTDPRLFKLISSRLMDEYKDHGTDRHHIDEMSWLCKALAASGSQTYADTFQEIIENTTSLKLKKYAKQGLELLSEYAERNKLMNDMSTAIPDLSDEENRYINMLRSDNITLKKDTAKSIYRGNFTAKSLYDALNDELIRWYNSLTSTTRNENDTLAWMCKALGASGMAGYKPTLEKIYKTTSSPSLKNHARKSMNML